MGFVRQVLFLLILILRLKGFRMIIGLLSVAGIVSNTYLYSAIESVAGATSQSYLGLTTYGADEFIAGSKVLINSMYSAKTNTIKEIVNSRSSSRSSKWLIECSSESDCKSKYLYNLHSTFGGVSHGLVDFDDPDVKMAAIRCLLTTDSSFSCSYLLHLVTQSLESNASYVFKDLRFLSLVSRSARTTDFRAMEETVASQVSSSASDSICTKSGVLFGQIFPIVLMLQMLIVSLVLVIYITFGSLYSINRLKMDGFLQLMFQNGLSVNAYWCATWLITIVEMAVFGVVAVLGFGLQCPGYYSSGALFLTFFTIFLFGIYISALGYLFSSLIKSYFIVIILMILLFVAQFTIILVTPFLDENRKHIRDILLILPFGHAAELLRQVLVIQTALSGYTLVILIICILITVLVIVLGLYIDFIFPNGNGYRLPPIFPLKSQFWRPSENGNGELVHLMGQIDPRPNIEPVEEGLRSLISVTDVIKTYEKRDYPCSSLKITVALSKVSCTIYDGQITALIGHNGAGKTTLLKVLIGEENTSSGKAIVDKCLVTDPLQRLSLRGRIGICHQTNVLCSDLTISQSIELVLMSRGHTTASRQSEVSDLLSRLDLDDKVGVKATQLSGGQMRKLCTLLALIGDPKVIFLDEPTSGLDPVSRRRLWQILQEYKVGRAIVLCTQFMDEADILADRKIFLSSGSLICAGSSLFLKHAFGCGYVLNVSLKSEELLQQLISRVQAVCPAVRLSNQFRTELELALPSSESASLPAIVRLLEEEETLVDAFGLSQATLDDIFMRLKDVQLTQIEAAFQSGQLSSFAEHKGSANREGQEELQKLLSSQSTKASSATAPQQFSALMKMNLTRLKREKLKLCCRFIFPIILLLSLMCGLLLELLISRTGTYIPIVSKIGISYVPNPGVCIKDVEDATNVTKDVCASALGLESQLKSESQIRIAVVSKSQATDLSKFILNETVLNIFNATCYYGYYAYCPIVYSSSWNLSDVNNNRSVQLGYFTGYVEYSFGTSSVGRMFGLYSTVAKLFNTTSPSEVYSVGYTQYLFTFSFSMGLYVFIFLFSVIPVTYISDPIEDKESKVRYHLTSMGMSGIGYWFNTYVLHWCQYGIFVVASTILHVAVVSDKYGNAVFIAGLMIPILFLGCATNQLSAYAIGSVMKKPNSVITVLYFFIIMILSIAIPGIMFSSEASLVLIWVIPAFAPMALMTYGIKVAQYALAYYNLQSIGEIPGLFSIYLSHPFVQHSFIAMAVHIVLMTLFIAVLENRSLIASFCCRFVSRKAPIEAMLNPSTDSGVKQESQRVNTASRNHENILEVNRLEKQYDNGVKAVKGITFGSMAGEIFGLLGPNGAGKTTTLSIVVGEEVASNGTCEVRFQNDWMSGRNGAVNGAVGYCPQHNPLFENITVMEHLNFYAEIRGVSRDLAVMQIANLVNGLGLSEHKEKQAHQLSGGNKRRLCLAISLLGNPSLVVIDEASTGVDPEAKRSIWSAIRGMANNQRSVVVTTHSMEEVEALCSRVGIMNHGLMIAFGTIQQLRSRYGNAYTLDILLSSSIREERENVRGNVRRAIGSILVKFPQGKLVEELHNRVQFLLPQDSIGCLSDALAWLTNSQAELGIQYLTLYQMSLDQVFVRLVKEQEEVKRLRRNSSLEALLDPDAARQYALVI